MHGPGEDEAGVFVGDFQGVGCFGGVTGQTVYVDMGGFLGLGATRKNIASYQIQDVKNDRIVLKLSEAAAEGLPAAANTEK